MQAPPLASQTFFSYYKTRKPGTDALNIFTLDDGKKAPAQKKEESRVFLETAIGRCPPSTSCVVKWQ